MDISISLKGDFKNTQDFLKRLLHDDISNKLDAYGRQGVIALSSATPVDTGDTAHQWTYEVVKDRTSYTIMWSNNHVVDGVPVVILLQYGHGTGTGGYIKGHDFINPALRPIFEKLSNDVRKVVTSK